jgi:hypothetical protein
VSWPIRGHHSRDSVRAFAEVGVRAIVSEAERRRQVGADKRRKGRWHTQIDSETDGRKPEGGSGPFVIVREAEPAIFWPQ